MEWGIIGAPKSKWEEVIAFMQARFVWRAVYEGECKGLRQIDFFFPPIETGTVDNGMSPGLCRCVQELLREEGYYSRPTLNDNDELGVCIKLRLETPV